MSGLYVIFQPGAAAVNASDLEAMHRVFAQWYDDGHGNWFEGPVGLGHTLRWNTPESKLEQLPAAHGATGQRLVITADVRLDNRAALAGSLKLTAPLATLTDSDLLLAAYKQWGEDCPRHLLGDFAFVIWDEARQQLFCARDHLGVKSLYYSCEGGRWVLANHVHAVVALDGASKAISEGAVCRYLKDGELYSPTLTFYEAVKKLPPATRMVISAAGSRSEQYWRIDDCPPVRLASPAAYVERLRELLEEAVACRLRSAYPVAAHLSGGLDSSTIVALAARQLASRGGVLHSYNWCPDPATAAGEAAREWARGSELVASAGVQHHYVDYTSERYAALLTGHDLTGNDTVDLWYEFDVRRAAAAAGQRTILSGWGGDQGISNNGTCAPGDMFWHGRPLSALRQVWAAARHSERPWRRVAGLLFRKIVLPVMPDAVAARFANEPEDTEDFAGCATAGIAARVKALAPAWHWRRVNSVRADQLQQFHCGHLQNRLESWAASAHREGIEYRYPLLDKRVVEFALGIPPECYWQQGTGRYLFRAAAAHRLPAELCWGNFKLEMERVRRMQEVERDAFALLAARGCLAQAEGGSGLVDDEAVQAALIRFAAFDVDPLNISMVDLGETIAKSLLLRKL